MTNPRMGLELLGEGPFKGLKTTGLERTALVCDFAGSSGFRATCRTARGGLLFPTPEFDGVSTREQNSRCRLLQKPLPQAGELGRQRDILCRRFKR